METVKLGLLIKKTKVARCGEHSYPVLSITKQNGIIMQSEKFKKRIASADTSDYKIIPRGKLVQGIHIDEGNFGIQDIVDNGIVSPAYGVWDVNDGLVIPKYLEMVLRSPKSIEFYRSKLTGTVNRRGHMSDTDFLSMDIPLPDRDTQSEILKTMKQTTSILSFRQQQLTKLDELIKARFGELFDGKYPEDTLLNLCNIIDYRGKTPEKVESGLPFITAKNVKMHHMTLEPREYISKETYDKVMVRGFPKEGDVVFTTEAPLGNVCKIPHFDTEFYIGQRIVTMQTDTLNPTYLEYALSNDEFVRKYMGKSSGSTVTGIRVRLLEQLTIPVPPRALQDEFSIFANQVDKSKSAVQKSLDETQVLFDSLMQKYFG